MFGIVPPQAIDCKTRQVSLTIRRSPSRSPKGKLELVYLDQELRITREARGTVLVGERQIEQVRESGVVNDTKFPNRVSTTAGWPAQNCWRPLRLEYRRGYSD